MKKVDEGGYTTGKTVFTHNGQISWMEHTRFDLDSIKKGKPVPIPPGSKVCLDSHTSCTKALAGDGHILEIHDSKTERLYTITDSHRTGQAVEGSVRIRVTLGLQHATAILFTTVKSGSTIGIVKF